jgi:magnesium transporter
VDNEELVMGEARFFHIVPDGGLVALPSLEAALGALAADGYVWLDYVDPTHAQLHALVGPLGIHSLSIEDCFDDQQVPKIDLFPDHAFILVNSYGYGERRLATDEMDFFLGKNYLVSVSGRGNTDRGFHGRLEERVRQDLDTARKGPDFLLHTILDFAVDGKFGAIEALEEDINATEEAMLADAPAFNLQDLMFLRRALLALRKGLYHEREVLMKICRRDCPFVSEAAIYYFRDIYDHLAKFFELIEINRDIVTSLTEMYLSLINNQMARAANRTNRTVRRLTLITTIFMPLTLIAGVGGMSEWSMMTGPQNWRIAYPAFIAGMVLIGALNYFLLRWIESRHPDRPE